MANKAKHVPVMVDEVIRYLEPERAHLVIDATVGLGGHAAAILRANPDLTLVGVDRDPQALDLAREVLAPYGDRVHLVRADYADLDRYLPSFGRADGVLLDLGVSSLQLDDATRGFSYAGTGPLGMSMAGDAHAAEGYLARADVRELARVLKEFGDVRYAGRVARAIKRRSDSGCMATTRDLREAIETGLGHRAPPAVLSRAFQAIRIAINDEIGSLDRFLAAMLRHLTGGARVIVLSYHSLEDRAVKRFFKRESSGCICPPNVPACACGHTAVLEVLTRRAITPRADEISANPRARSARLRAARILDGGKVAR